MPDGDDTMNRTGFVKPYAFHIFPPFLSCCCRIFGKIRIFQILTKSYFAMVMMMITFITINTGLDPLIEGLCAQILF